MGLCDLFRPAKKTDPVFGDLVYRWGAWRGTVSIPDLHALETPLEIYADRTCDLSKLRPLLTCLRDNIQDVKEQIAVVAFETYETYVQEDRSSGNFTDADFAQHPFVSSAADIWRVLKPFRLTISNEAKEYNVIIWLDVDWPNPHYFVAHLNNAKLYLLDVDG